MEKYISIEDLVANAAPHFAYQIQFASGNLEEVIRSKGEIRQFLSALYGGKTEKREIGFDAEKGVLLDKLPHLKPSRLLSEEVSHLEYLSYTYTTEQFRITIFQELDYYSTEFARNGIHGPRMISLPHILNIESMLILR